MFTAHGSGPLGVCFYGACVTGTPVTLSTSHGGQKGASFHVCNQERPLSGQSRPAPGEQRKQEAGHLLFSVQGDWACHIQSCFQGHEQGEPPPVELGGLDSRGGGAGAARSPVFSWKARPRQTHGPEHGRLLWDIQRGLSDKPGSLETPHLEAHCPRWENPSVVAHRASKEPVFSGEVRAPHGSAFPVPVSGHRPVLPGTQRSLLQGKPRCCTPGPSSSAAALGDWGEEGKDCPREGHRGLGCC